MIKNAQGFNLNCIPFLAKFLSLRKTRTRKYLQLKKNGKNVLEIFSEIRKENNTMDSIIKIREVFEELTLIEAKEILIISETNFNDLEEYQKDLMNKFKELK